jgi:flagellar biosynthesis protein FlhF
VAQGGSEIHAFEGRSLREAMMRAREELGPSVRMMDTCRLDDGGWQVRAQAGSEDDDADQPAETGSAEGSARRDRPESGPAAGESGGGAADSGGGANPVQGGEALLEDLRAEVAELQRLVQSIDPDPREEGEELLRRQGLSPAMARALWQMERKGKGVEQALRISQELFSESPVRAALVGPTGSGKTTTIAKLAAYYVLEGRSVYLVGTDTFRIGALDQLQQYARIMDVPLSVARSAEELGRVLERAEGYDAVLVDTIGRGGRAANEVAELAEMFKPYPSLKRHLVLAANTDLEDTRAGWQTFRRLELSSLVTTKLDETARPGRAAEVAVAAGLPLSAFGTGQRVPEDFGFYDYPEVRRLLLGEDSEEEAG